MGSASSTTTNGSAPNNAGKSANAKGPVKATIRKPSARVVGQRSSFRCIGDQEFTGEIKDFITGDTALNLEQVFLGNPRIKCKQSVKVVRIFTSSTFTDTKHERNALMERVYPKLKSFCQDLGYDFQVVDMRWGVREEAQDDHLTTELCMKELEACQSLSTGPNFVTFLSHKYGYRPFPRRIPQDEFEQITKGVNDEEKNVLEIWFLKDKNAVPPEYILQPISTVIPEYLSHEQATKREACRKWWQTFECLQEILIEGAMKNLQNQDRIHQYLMSVTEREIVEGILKTPDPAKHCLWFNRQIKDIESAPMSKTVSRYYECSSQRDQDQEAHGLIEELREKKLPKKLPPESIVKYEVSWTDSGIDPSKSAEHKEYIDNLCKDFEKRLKCLIQSGIEDRHNSEVGDILYNEIVQHINFARSKCEKFCGRQSIIMDIESYIKGGSSEPLILHGSSGCGKTSILAVAAVEAWNWTRGKAPIVYRFLGTTRASSSLRPLLFSIAYQLSCVYNKATYKPRLELKYLVEDFKDSLALATKGKPLVLILDSLDQLDSSDGGRHLHWLPRRLPPNVKLILSTLPEAQYECFPRCKGLYKEARCYREVPKLDQADACSILDKWLKLSHRTLTPVQRDIILTAIQACPLPLFLKLSFDDALRWHSYDPVSVTQLKDTVTDTIHNLMWRIERRHGKIMVGHALGYITAARNGLTEGEIEDLLSLSDQVLNDVYQFWMPPIRRLPPLLWVRVRNELQEYLVNRGVDGVQVIYWYHRQFIEVAESRYLDEEDERFRYHLALSEYFLGIWSERPKPYVNNQNEEQRALRFVAKQPLRFENGEFNLRKLMQLPYHMIQAREVSALKSQTLCNFDFLVSKLQATSYGVLLQDLKMARATFPEDQDLQVVTECLQLSQEALTFDAGELSSQLIGRIHGTGSSSLLDSARAMLDAGALPPEAVPLLSLLESFEVQHERRSKYLVQLLDQAHKPAKPSLLPNRGFLVPPGGQLMYQLAGNHGTLTDIDLSRTGEVAITGSHDKTVKLWDVNTGDMMQSVEVGEEVGHMLFITDDQQLLASCHNKIVFLVDVDIGIVLREFRGLSGADERTMCMQIGICVDSGNNERLITMRNTAIDVWDIDLESCINTMKLKLDDWSTHNKGINMEGRFLLTYNQYIVYAGYRGQEYYILSINNKQFHQQVTVFPPHKFNVDSHKPDFAGQSDDHIGALAITGDGSLLLVCNGRNQNLLIYKLIEGQLLRTLKSDTKAKMSSFYLPMDSEWFYYTQGTYVGMWNLKTNEKITGLQHPCKVKKVVGVNAQVVVTIAADNLMRIWDKSKKAFMQDLSSFTGKAKVGKSTDTAALKFQFDAMFTGILGEAASTFDTNNLLTTEETKNYWTRESDDSDDAKVISKFFYFDNPMYIAIVQNDINDEYSLCLSVWDIMVMSCVRRMFFPPKSVYIHTIYEDKTVVLTENRKLKLMDIRHFNIYQVLQGLTFDQRPPFVLYVKQQKELITESRGGRYLKVYDPMKGEASGDLVPSSQPLKQHLSQTAHDHTQLNSLKANKDGSIVAALYASSTPTIYLWDLPTRTVIHAINSRTTFPGLRNEQVHFSFSESGNHIVMLKDTKVNSELSEKDMSIVNVKTGQPCGFAKPGAESVNVEVDDLDRTVVMRHLGHTYIQMIAITPEGKGAVLGQQDVGCNANHLMTSQNKNYVVTWFDEPKEKTLRYWKFDLEGNKFELLGTFTPDTAASDVAVVQNGKELIIDSATGLIKLQVLSRSQRPKTSINKNKQGIYKGIDLNITFPTGDKYEDSIGDPDDPDVDTDTPR